MSETSNDVAVLQETGSVSVALVHSNSTDDAEIELEVQFSDSDGLTNPNPGELRRKSFIPVYLRNIHYLP